MVRKINNLRQKIGYPTIHKTVDVEFQIIHHKYLLAHFSNTACYTTRTKSLSVPVIQSFNPQSENLCATL